jgi:hypothetical protein
MRSPLAEELRGEQAREALEMTPGERLATALARGERAVADYMANFGVDRDEALRALRRAGQAGRRYSACMDESADERFDRDRR